MNEAAKLLDDSRREEKRADEKLSAIAGQGVSRRR
jgi:ferritin-like metal-binding protein YciE